MVSKEALEVIRMYETDMPFLLFALFDTEKEESKSYYCPILETDNKKAAIYRKMPENEIKIRLDLAESLLIRGAGGMELTN